MPVNRNIDDLAAEDLDIEVMRAFHFGGSNFAVSVELSDKNYDNARYYVLLVEFSGSQINYSVVLQREKSMLSHVSNSADEHFVLESGGITHILNGGKHVELQGPEEFLNKLYYASDGSLFTYGEDGCSCELSGRNWQPIKPANKSFLRVMHGPDRKLIHAAGDHGTLLHLQGDHWQQVPLDFNNSIQALYVSKDSMISMGCEDGYCYQTRDSAIWPIVGLKSDLQSICEFKGARYWGDDDFGLFVEKDRRLVEFRALESAYSLEATEALLVGVGWKEVFIFDGVTWSGFEFGYDGKLYAHIVDMNKRYK